MLSREFIAEVRRQLNDPEATRWDDATLTRKIQTVLYQLWRERPSAFYLENVGVRYAPPEWPAGRNPVPETNEPLPVREEYAQAVLHRTVALCLSENTEAASNVAWVQMHTTLGQI